MPPHSRYCLPEIRVVHFGSGPDQSISIEEFLRSIKRDRGSYSPNRRAPKRRQSDSTTKQLSQSRGNNAETSLPVLDDQTPVDLDAQQAHAEAPIESHNSGQDHDLHSALEKRYPQSASQRTKVKKVYRRKHKYLVSPLFTSDLTPPASVRNSPTEESPKGTARRHDLLPHGMSAVTCC